MSPRPCPDCAHPDPGKFCPKCGQPQAEDLVPTLSRWLREVLDELVFVEARLPRTLATLAIPGKLTKAWLKGRRSRFVSPLRLYLLSVIRFFFLFSPQKARTTPRDELTLSWLLMAGVEAGYLTSDVFAEDSAGHYSYAPLEPLPPELAEDSAARAAWREEFEEQRAEASREEEALVDSVQGGMSQILTVLPVVVGVEMVPVLAILLLLGPQPARRFVGRMVYSLHLHTVGYVIMAVCWLVRAPLLAGLLGCSSYPGLSQLRIHGRGWRRGIVILGQAIAVPGAYLGIFFFTYFGLVQGLATFAPAFVFSK